MKLKDKVILVTDAGTAAGAEIVGRLAAEGALTALNTYPAKHGEVPAGGLSLHASPESKDEIEGAVRAVVEKYGKIDTVVYTNNEIIDASIEDCTDEIFDRVMNINLKSAFFYVRAAGRFMKEARQGNFVFLSSIHDEKPQGRAFTYSVSRGALKMLVREMVLDLGPYNVRSNIVQAGPVEGDEQKFCDDITPLYEQTIEKMVSGKWVGLKDIADAVVFFSGDECQAANGSELAVDGGFLLSYIIRGKIYEGKK